MQNRINLYIDFDNTIVKSTKRLVEFLNIKYETNVNYKEIKDYNCQDKFPNVTIKEILDIFDDKDFFNGLEFYKDCLKTLIKHKKYCNYNIVTLGSLTNLINKQQWCSQYIPIKKVFIGINHIKDTDKSSIDMSDGIIIDDHIDNLRNSNAKYKILFKGGFDTDWNTKLPHEDFIEVYDWCELDTVLNNLLLNNIS